MGFGFSSNIHICLHLHNLAHTLLLRYSVSELHSCYQPSRTVATVVIADVVKICLAHSCCILLFQSIQKGNIEGAKIHAENAIRQKNQALNYRRMSARIDAVAARVQTALTTKQVRCLSALLLSVWFVIVNVKSSSICVRVEAASKTHVCWHVWSCTGDVIDGWCR